MIILVLCELTTGMAKERVDKREMVGVLLIAGNARGFRSTSVRVISGMEIGRCAV